MLKKINKAHLLGGLAFWVVTFLSGVVWAQGRYDQPLSKPILILVSLSALALVPFLMMMVTSFVKIVVVLALIRSALGTQQIPPNPVVTGLAMVLTLYIMMPVAKDIYRETRTVVQSSSNQGFLSTATMGLLYDGVMKGREPLRSFLIKHAQPKDRKLFYDLSKKMSRPEDREDITSEDFVILVPSFVISELSEAFQIGFVIFLPFLIIDMVVANILLALGMFQISPITISLPFKLLLFVLVDGWYLIVQGLLLGYR